MKIDLAGRHACLVAERDAIAETIATALQDNDCTVSYPAAEAMDPVPDILILARAFRVDGKPDPAATGVADSVGAGMIRRGSGRIVMLLSAFAAVPAKRFPETSAAAAEALARIRVLAMRLGPTVLVNAIGCGAIGAEGDRFLSGDASMLSHVPTGQPGTAEDIANAVLFLCDPMNSYMTGQMLTVDGGWSAGYGRNF